MSIEIELVDKATRLPVKCAMNVAHALTHGHDDVLVVPQEGSDFYRLPKSGESLDKAKLVCFGPKVETNHG